MAVISVEINSTPTARRWETPQAYVALRSPIPQGLLTYKGVQAIATKLAGNQTAIRLNLLMPSGYAYLVRMIALRFQSDDLVLEYDVNGYGQWAGAGFLGQVDNPGFNILATGKAFSGAANANIHWQPTPTVPKIVQVGGDTMILRVNDMDAGETTSGDFSFWSEFYIFDVDQVDKWEVNTPIPVISHTSF